MDPKSVARSLRRVAADIDSSRSPDARAAAGRLSRMAKAVEEPVRPPVVKLKGPFRPAKKGETEAGGGQVDGEVEDGFVIDNEDFMAAAAGFLGPNITPEDFEGGYHYYVLDAGFHHEPSDPSVGYYGGTDLEEWDLVSLDGVVLENPEDRRSVEEALAGEVEARKADWIREWDEAQADAAAEARAEARYDRDY